MKQCGPMRWRPAPPIVVTLPMCGPLFLPPAIPSLRLTRTLPEKFLLYPPPSKGSIHKMLPFFRIAIVPDRCYRETQFSPWTPGERQKHSPGPARIGRRLTKNHGVCLPPLTPFFCVSKVFRYDLRDDARWPLAL